MDAALIRIADAVVAQLNASPRSLPFEARRYYQPIFDLAEMKTLHVSVVPKGMSTKRIARDRNMHDYQVDVAVQKKFANGDAPELDPLMGLVQEFAALFQSKVLPDFVEALCIRVENAPVYAPEHMENLRQFTSVLTLTFRRAE